MQDMSEGSKRAVKTALGATEFSVKVDLHQGSALSVFPFAIEVHRLTNGIWEKSPWNMMFAYDLVLCSESREIEASLEKWRHVLEKYE